MKTNTSGRPERPRKPRAAPAVRSRRRDGVSFILKYRHFNQKIQDAIAKNRQGDYRTLVTSKEDKTSEKTPPGKLGFDC